MLTSLTASNAGITGLKGIENTRNLLTLQLDRNQITNITPLTELVQHKELNLRMNRIADFTPLEGMINLNKLEISGDQIKDIHRCQFKENTKPIIPQDGRFGFQTEPDPTRKPFMKRVYHHLFRASYSRRIRCDKDIAPTGLGTSLN